MAGHASAFMKVSGCRARRIVRWRPGFRSGAGDALASVVLPFKLGTRYRNAKFLPYCAVACGVPDLRAGRQVEERQVPILHFEGDPDHPFNRGTLVRELGLLWHIHSATRLNIRCIASGHRKFER